MDIKITKATELKTKPTLEEEASLGFGKRFTDHMFMMNYDNGEWHDARIVPYQRLSLDPSCSVLHYAQEIFEGLKASSVLRLQTAKLLKIVFSCGLLWFQSLVLMSQIPLFSGCL